MLSVSFYTIGFAESLAGDLSPTSASGSRPWSDDVGRIIGTGPGRGLGLMLSLLGVVTLAAALAATPYRPMCRLEDTLPYAMAE